MDKVPISFEEKIEARFKRKGKGSCWPWDGSIATDRRPQLNLRDVIRFIYERERGPIPPGMILKRTDHIKTCRYGEDCSHELCVNPWHVEPRLPHTEGWGVYTRENPWPGDDTSHAAEYQRRVRARRKKRSNGEDGNQKDFHVPADDERSEGVRVEESDERERSGP